MKTNADASNNLTWNVAMPALLVFLWSTGFIGAKFGLPYAEPFTFVSIRFAIAAAILTIFAWYSRAPWPRTAREIINTVIVGMALHGTYLTAVFVAIYNGTPAWVAALLTGLHPLLTALSAGWALDERIRPAQWLGFVLGLAGISLILWQSGPGNSGSALPTIGLIACTVGLLALTGGTLFQKRFGSATDLRTGQAIQQMAALALVLPGAFLFETRVVQWTGEFIFALSWLTGILSIGMFTLLYTMIRRGAASKVASLFYLVPPVVALESFFLFDEVVTLRQIAGMVLAGIGVALVTRTPKAAQAAQAAQASAKIPKETGQ
jgi:drug/metabolite transporter (DMT)-like permease